jgi:hypothetical protein
MNRTTEQEIDQRPEEQSQGASAKCPTCSQVVALAGAHVCAGGVKVYRSGPFRSFREAAEHTGITRPMHCPACSEQGRPAIPAIPCEHMTPGPGDFRRQLHSPEDTQRVACRWCGAPAGQACRPQLARHQDDRGICYSRSVDYASSHFDPALYVQRGQP